MVRQGHSLSIIVVFLVSLLGFASTAESKCTIDQMIDAMTESDFNLNGFEEVCDFDIDSNKCSFHELEEKIQGQLEEEPDGQEGPDKEKIATEVKEECIN